MKPVHNEFIQTNCWCAKSEKLVVMILPFLAKQRGKKGGVLLPDGSPLFWNHRLWLYQSWLKDWKKRDKNCCGFLILLFLDSSCQDRVLEVLIKTSRAMRETALLSGTDRSIRMEAVVNVSALSNVALLHYSPGEWSAAHWNVPPFSSCNITALFREPSTIANLLSQEVSCLPITFTCIANYDVY